MTKYRVIEFEELGRKIYVVQVRKWIFWREWENFSKKQWAENCCEKLNKQNNNMRFKDTNPVPGDIRQRKFFAWFPVMVYNEHRIETRWLCKVEVEEKYRAGAYGNVGYWDAVKFLN